MDDIYDPPPEPVDPESFVDTTTSVPTRFDGTRIREILLKEEASGKREVQTFKCRDCWDKGFIFEERTVRDHVCYFAWYCKCDLGVRIEIAFWFDKLYQPNRIGQRFPSQDGSNLFEKYRESHPMRHSLMVGFVRERLRQYKEARKNKLEEAAELA